MAKPSLLLRLPTYTCADYLDQFLRSIWEQSRADVEASVADNVSIDNAFKVVTRRPESTIWRIEVSWISEMPSLDDIPYLMNT